MRYTPTRGLIHTNNCGAGHNHGQDHEQLGVGTGSDVGAGRLQHGRSGALPAELVAAVSAAVSADPVGSLVEYIRWLKVTPFLFSRDLARCLFLLFLVLSLPSLLPSISSLVAFSHPCCPLFTCSLQRNSLESQSSGSGSAVALLELKELLELFEHFFELLKLLELLELFGPGQ